MTTTLSIPELVDGVGALVTERGDATVGMIARYAQASGMTTDGDMYVSLVRNVWIAVDVSPEFAELIPALQADGRLIAAPADLLALTYEGDPLYRLPLAKTIPENGYAKPHRLPIRLMLRK